jgi:hypothetical protein
MITNFTWWLFFRQKEQTGEASDLRLRLRRVSRSAEVDEHAELARVPGFVSTTVMTPMLSGAR